MIPLSVPVVNGNEWKYVKECLDTGWVSSVGSYVTLFEEKLAEYVGASYAVATVNGTAALHLGLIVSGVQDNDEVIVPTLTFVAPVNVVRYVGAIPVFMDCDIDTLCLDIGKVEEFLVKETNKKSDGFSYNRKTGRRIKAIIPVHIFGHPVDMDHLMSVAKKFNMEVIEDATESIGSEYNGKRTGMLGNIGCFSFNGNKIITTGGGGMVVLDSEETAKRIKHLSTQAKSDPIEYDHDEIGYNYRLTNVLAAIGVAQMEKLDEFVKIKRQNVDLYRKLLSDIDDVEIIGEQQWSKSNFWFYTLKAPMRHKKPLMEHLLKNNIQVRPIWKLTHTLPMYREFQAYKIEKALEAYDSCINLPCSVDIKEAEVEAVALAIKKFFD